MWNTDDPHDRGSRRRHATQHPPGVAFPDVPPLGPGVPSLRELSATSDDPATYGLFSLTSTPTINDLIWVTWNKRGSGRYAQVAADVTPPDPADDPTVHYARTLTFHYSPDWSRVAMTNLTSHHRLPAVRALLTVARAGPWEGCMFCGNLLTSDADRLFGATPHCLAKRAAISRRSARIALRTHIAAGVSQVEKFANQGRQP